MENHSIPAQAVFPIVIGSMPPDEEDTIANLDLQTSLDSLEATEHSSESLFHSRSGIMKFRFAVEDNKLVQLPKLKR